jgi:hypothetical protein
MSAKGSALFTPTHPFGLLVAFESPCMSRNAPNGYASENIRRFSLGACAGVHETRARREHVNRGRGSPLLIERERRASD